MDYVRLYKWRFQGVEPQKKRGVWREITLWVYDLLGKPKNILDPACGDLEFLSHIPKECETWGVDLRVSEESQRALSKYIVGNVFSVELPKAYFEAVFVSNFLEHLSHPNEIFELLKKLEGSLSKGGQIAIMGPNFKYCSRVYFDCADHILPLTHVAVQEHLAMAGFKILHVIPRFIPYSFRSHLPSSSFLTRLYLKCSWLWPLFGKQFLVIGEKQ
jgi:ubiquinone/menaquinone biosynthesis C-methylase UbiE